MNTLPHYGGQGCQATGITPEDQRQGIVNNIPAGFNPLPSTYPAANQLEDVEGRMGCNPIPLFRPRVGPRRF